MSKCPKSGTVPMSQSPQFFWLLKVLPNSSITSFSLSSSSLVSKLFLPGLSLGIRSMTLPCFLYLSTCSLIQLTVCSLTYIPSTLTVSIMCLILISVSDNSSHLLINPLAYLYIDLQFLYLREVLRVAT